MPVCPNVATDITTAIRRAIFRLNFFIETSFLFSSTCSTNKKRHTNYGKPFVYLKIQIDYLIVTLPQDTAMLPV
jgi:hypothetical protein